MLRKIFSGMFFLILLAGCSSSDDYAGDEEQPVPELSIAQRTNAWIYSRMNHYYLWREDLPDSATCDFNLTPTQFFETLLSDKDRFSFVDFASRSTVVPDYGFAYQRMKGSGNEYLHVLYVTSDVVRRAGISRGDLLAARGFGDPVAEFDVMRPSDGGFAVERTVTLGLVPATRAIDVSQTVYVDSVYNVGGKKVGYLCYLEFDSARDFYSSMNKFAEVGIDELVLDLRYNPGGYENTCKTLCNAIVSPSAYGNVFVKHSYNDIVAEENRMRYGDEFTYEYYEAPREFEGPVLGETCPSLGLSRVFVLTSRHSASSSELAIISLRPFMNVIVIGENSTGKGVGMQGMTVPGMNYQLWPITFRFYNAEGETVPEDGIAPHYYIPDGYSTAKRDLGDTAEPLLQCALNQIRMGEWEMYQGAADATRAAGLEPVGEPSFVTSFRLRRGGGAVR